MVSIIYEYPRTTTDTLDGTTGSLQSITTKLQLLLTMLNTPPPGSVIPEGTATFTPFERLKLLREVTEDARVFRLGGEDKIRVATGTCETVSCPLAAISKVQFTHDTTPSHDRLQHIHHIFPLFRPCSCPFSRLISFPCSHRLQHPTVIPPPSLLRLP